MLAVPPADIFAPDISRKQPRCKGPCPPFATGECLTRHPRQSLGCGKGSGISSQAFRRAALRPSQDGNEMAQGNSGNSRRTTRTNQSGFSIYANGGSTDEIRLTINLVLSARRWRSLLDEHLRTIGQSAARMEALAAIMNSPSLSAQVDIAKRLRIEGPTMTRMLDTLEKDGLVQRLPDPTDRRTKQLRLTDEGEEVLERIFEIAETLRDRLLDGFSAEEIARQNAFFTKLQARLDAGLPGNDVAE